MRGVWLLITAVACKGAEKSEVPVSAGSGRIESPRADSVAIDAALPATCADPCVYLVDQAMADAATKYEAECHAKWVFSSDDSCERYQYAINCIYAARGKVFVTPAWKDRFVSKPWYRPREDFKESDLPPVARQTIQYLRGEDKMCRASKTLTATERDKVVATYEKIRNADLKIPNIKQDDLLTFFELFGTLTVADDTIFDLEWRTPTGFRVKISNLVYERSNNPHDKLVIRLTFEDGKLWEVAWESE